MSYYSGGSFLHGIQKLLKDELSVKELPKLPRDIIEWIQKARPLVDGYPRHLGAF